MKVINQQVLACKMGEVNSWSKYQETPTIKLGEYFSDVRGHEISRVPYLYFVPDLYLN